MGFWRIYCLYHLWRGPSWMLNHMHVQTRTARKRGLKMLIQTHTDEGCKSSPHCVFSTLAALCSSESLYSIELPSILTVAPSRHVQGAPTGAPCSLNTHKGCLHTHLQTARRSKDPLVPLRPDATLCRVIIISWGMPKFIWRVGVCTRCCQAVWYEDICVRERIQLLSLASLEYYVSPCPRDLSVLENHSEFSEYH